MIGLNNMIKFEKINKMQFKNDCKHGEYSNIKLPRRSTTGSAGYDFISPIDVKMLPKRSYLIPTGIKCFMDNDMVLKVYIRSSMAIKHGIRLVNSVAIIDSDFALNTNNDGHIHIAVENIGHEVYEIKIGDKIAQGIICKYYTTDDDDVDAERTGGIGSTGN